jgi:hypothetical protein
VIAIVLVVLAVVLVIVVFGSLAAETAYRKVRRINDSVLGRETVAVGEGR